MPECPECGLPVDGAAKGRRRHFDCQGRVDRATEVARLRRQMFDYEAEGKTVSWIAAHLHIGTDTVRKLMKDGQADVDRD